MSEVRTSGESRMRREGRGGLGGMLVILFIVGIEGARLVRRRVDRKPMLLGWGLDIVWRTPRHDGPRLFLATGLGERTEDQCGKGSWKAHPSDEGDSRRRGRME